MGNQYMISLSALFTYESDRKVEKDDLYDFGFVNQDHGDAVGCYETFTMKENFGFDRSHISIHSSF